jgi:hypothetical protein
MLIASITLYEVSFQSSFIHLCYQKFWFHNFASEDNNSVYDFACLVPAYVGIVLLIIAYNALL